MYLNFNYEGAQVGEIGLTVTLDVFKSNKTKLSR